MIKDLLKNDGTLQMMRINVISQKWITTDIKLGSGSWFEIYTIASSPSASFDDFYFAGEGLSLTDGMTVKSFGNNFGFIMKSKINSVNETCFSFPTFHSIDIGLSVSFLFD